MRLRDEIVRRVADAGVNGLARGTLVTELGAAEADMKLLMRLLSEEGTVRVLGNRLLHVPVIEECRKKLLELFEQSSTVEVSAFRQATGAARNQAVAILEHFDSEGMTRRLKPGEGKGRTLVKPTGKPTASPGQA